MTSPKFEILTRSQYYFHLKAANGKITLSSEGYTSEQSCRGGIDSVKRNAPFDNRFERKEGNGSYTFILKAANGETIGRSESYTTASARDYGIESVKNDAPVATVVKLN